jgi:carbonic anhydrase/acetyltransferase-like protein (isoleucine patch superfamily)
MVTAVPVSLVVIWSEEYVMLIARNGQTPQIHETARVASTAVVVGNVTVGAGCFLDYNVVVASSGAPIVLEAGVMVLAGSVIRSTGGTVRPAFPVTIGAHTLISPQCGLVGCQIGAHCYLATQVMVFQGAQLGDGCRVSAGAIVHVNAHLPPGSRVGLRHIAAPTPAGGVLITDDIATARARIAAADFFQTAFGSLAMPDQPQEELHEQVLAQLHAELFSWTDEPVVPDGEARS